MDYFFIKVDESSNSFLNLNITTSVNGYDLFDLADVRGYFEVVPTETADVDLYYEASQAYPIAMTKDREAQYIKEGSYVTGISENSNGVQSTLDSTLPPNDDPTADDSEVYVNDVEEATDSLDETVKITLDTAVTLTIPAGGKIF